MTSLEFTKNIVLQLSEDDRTQVVRKAVQKGFTVNGFSKKPHSAPALAIANCLGIKKQGKYFYEIILDVIKQLSYEERDNELYRLVERWTENVEEHEKIANELNDIICRNENNRKVQNSSPEQTDSSIIDNLNKEIEFLKGELVAARERGRQHKVTIQENKIEIDNLRKEIEYLKKCCRLDNTNIERLEDKNQKLIEISENKTVELEKMKQQVNELLEQMEILQKYKDNAPKILCVLKNRIDINIAGYDILTIHKWDDEVRNTINSIKFSQVWLVNQGFTYAVINEIKEFYSNLVIKEYLKCKDLMDTIGR